MNKQDKINKIIDFLNIDFLKLAHKNKLDIKRDYIKNIYTNDLIMVETLYLSYLGWTTYIIINNDLNNIFMKSNYESSQRAITGHTNWCSHYKHTITYN